MKRTLIAVGLVSAIGLVASQAAAAAVHYAVIGDTPCGSARFEDLADDVGESMADPDVRLTIHLADIKNASSQCSTSDFEAIRRRTPLRRLPRVRRDPSLPGVWTANGAGQPAPPVDHVRPQPRGGWSTSTALFE